MENQEAKRVAKRKEDDRISQLPEPILHHILCFLSQKKAVQTSVLSKSWRHLGPTRPVIDLRRDCFVCSHVRGIDGVCENCFEQNNKVFASILDRTFQRYHDRNLFAHELNLDMLDVGSKSSSVLKKWIPIFIKRDKPALTTIRFSNYNLPSVVLTAEYLRELHLNRCRFIDIISTDNVVLKNLRKLSLTKVDIPDEALENIISGCPLVEHLVLYCCKGFKTIGIKNRNLNYCEITTCFSRDQREMTSIVIDASALESIILKGYSRWHLNNNNYFPHLKSLDLSQVNLSTESFHNFSFNFPRLEELTLHYCRGFEEIELSSGSIKRISIQSSRSIKKVAIEVPNIRYFEFWNRYLPTSLSVTTTSREWKSNLKLQHGEYVYKYNCLSKLLKIFGLVKALDQSQISLTVSESLYFKISPSDWYFNDFPVVVEHLSLDIDTLSPDFLTHYLNALFRVFRPRYANAVPSYRKDDEKVTEFLWKTLIYERQKAEYGWEQHLEEVSIEASDEEGKLWYHVVQWTCLPEWSDNQKFRFRLKWRD